MRLAILSLLLLTLCASAQERRRARLQRPAAAVVYTNWFFLGDSLSKGDEIGNRSWIYWLTNTYVTVGFGSKMTNSSVGGRTVDDMRDKTNDIVPFIAVTGTNLELALRGGINDVADGATVSAITTNILLICNFVHALGGKATVFTVTESVAFTNDGAKLAVMLAVNQWITNGSCPADYVVDAYSQNPHVHEVTVDGVHLTWIEQLRNARDFARVRGWDTNALPQIYTNNVALHIKPFAERASFSNGDAIGSLYDYSGNGYSFTNPTTANKPFWTNDVYGSGVQFDGVSEFLVSSNSIDLSGTDKLTVYLVIGSAFTYGSLAEHSVNGVTTAGGYTLYGSGGAFSAFMSDGSVYNRSDPAASIAGRTVVITVVMDSASGTASQEMRSQIDIGTVTAGGNGSGQMTGNFGNHLMWACARAGGALFSGLILKELLVIKGTNDAATISSNIMSLSVRL